MNLWCLYLVQHMLHQIKAPQFYTNYLWGAQWLSGRVLDSRPRGHWFKPHRRHWVVVLEQDTFILAYYWFFRKIRPCSTERLLMGRKESNQTNKQILIISLISLLMDSSISEVEF